jgi:endonuclease/exonuclease/phosphatase family metal-dependent hydrolase
MKKLNKLFITLTLATFFHVAVHAQSQSDFKITTWNVEWLSCLSNGPYDRELQINNVVRVIKEMNSDIVALQEVGTSKTYTTIDTLVKRLGSEWAGKIVPWNSNNCSQNQGIIYKKSKVQLIYSTLITNGGSSVSWSMGRYPVLYDVDFVVGNERIPISFINIHAKAYSDEQSYARRKDASIALKNMLDNSTFSTERVVIIGDMNDYLIGTTCKTCGGISPYKNFMDDVVHYKGVTANLNSTIDNMIISYQLFDSYLDNSAFVERSATQIIPNYRNTTSDHYPISIKFHMTDEVSTGDVQAQSSVTAYPNPTNGPLTITISDRRFDKCDISIFDRVGKKVSNFKSQISNPTLDISNLIPGFYFIQITTEQEIITRKIIKL